MPSKGDALSYDQISLLSQWIKESPLCQALGIRKARPPEKFLSLRTRALFVTRLIPLFCKISSTRLDPSEPADKARWLRRVSPGLSDCHRRFGKSMPFSIDDSPNAREKVVERFLPRPLWRALGQAVVGFGPLCRFQRFSGRSTQGQLGVRDWVIEAMNADMPFDRFSIEQLAEIFFPDSTVSQKIAVFTGHRLASVEAGVHPEKNRVNQVFDRVNATGLTWLGTTLECAQCHSHKYDPFSQEEYFKLFFFQQYFPLEVRNKSGRAFPLTFGGRRWTCRWVLMKQRIHRLNSELALKGALGSNKKSRTGVSALGQGDDKESRTPDFQARLEGCPD